ncbi:MAG: hypothetical protein WCP33_04485 [Deltaproteobacteria bacterium]
MQRFLMVIYAFCFMSLIAGCSSEPKFSGYNTPSNYVESSPNAKLMGGSIQRVMSSARFSAKFTNYSVSTLAGTAGLTGLIDNTGAAARFNHPIGITTDGSYLYIADYSNKTIRKIDKANGNIVNTMQLTFSTAPANFYMPSDITTDGTFLYVADAGYNVVRVIDSNNKVTTIGSTSGLAGSIDSAADVASVRFNTPTGITTDGTNLYVVDSGNHTIRRIVIATKEVTTFAGTAGSYGSVDGKGTAAKFYRPARITTDGSNLYVTDFKNGTVRKIAIATGEVTTIAGTAGLLLGESGTGSISRFYEPNGITTDSRYLYVTDSYTNTLFKLAPSAGAYAVSMIIQGSSDKPGHLDTSEGSPSFNTPVGITTDGSNLYVADSINNTIRQIK